MAADNGTYTTNAIIHQCFGSIIKLYTYSTILMRSSSALQCAVLLCAKGAI